MQMQIALNPDFIRATLLTANVDGHRELPSRDPSVSAEPQ